jgi:hypothetical protein
MRYIVKKATKHWMVWDTAVDTVAVVDWQPAISLSAETANWMAKELNTAASDREIHPHKDSAL